MGLPALERCDNIGCADLPKREGRKEGDMEVLYIAFGFLILIWIAVLWGSRYFGSAP
jgi:hypothetical protein